MTSPIALLQQRSHHSWLMGLNCQSLTRRAETQFQALIQTSMQAGDRRPPTVLLSEPDPANFLADFIAACAANCPIFLGNPYWTEAEWQQVFEQVQPNVIWGVAKKCPSEHKEVKDLTPGCIMIPTGGSSGKVRFAVHTWQTLTASVMGFQQYFEADAVNCCCTLPFYHVSGLMQMMRSLLTGGKLVIVPFKQLAPKPPDSGLPGSRLPEFDPTDFFISLVPTQLQRLLQDPEAIAWLSQFHTVLLGGAPAWDDLLMLAKRHQIQLAPTYGMTETASQVATLKPADFLAGKTGCGRALPHAKIQIVDAQNQPMAQGQVGAIAIQSAALALGYYGNTGGAAQTIFQTDDLGYFDSEDSLHIVGRASRKIITGGENVFPDEVEAAIRATGLVADICVVGLPDRQWGEAVTAVYVPRLEVDVAQIREAIALQLSKFKQPKRWIAVETLSRNGQGKISYEFVKTLGD